MGYSYLQNSNLQGKLEKMEKEGKHVAGALLVLVVTSFLLKLFIKRRKAGSSDDDVFPRGPPAWPILGHLPLLVAGCPHKTLADLSRKHSYGPIIGLRLGSRHAVVISSASLARELLLVHDKTFANRPAYQFVETLLYGYDAAVAFSRYGLHFSRLRKLYTLELFTAKRLHQLQCIRQEEVCALLHRLHRASCDSQAIDLGVSLAEMSSNTISRLLQSKTLSEATNLAGAHGDASLPELIEKLVHETAPTLGDFIPWLKCLDLLPKRNMKYVHDCLDKVIDPVLRERRQVMRSRPPHELPHDFLQVLLSKEREASNHDEGFHHQEDLITTQQIKAIMLDILAAGIHTTALTLEWAMAELLRNPSCLGKVRDEIDAMMKGRMASAPPNPSRNGASWEEDQLITDEDLPKLPYLESTVKEVLRLHPVVPLLLPRISSQAAKVDKYTLPKHTHVFVNVWAIGRDPDVWEQAEAFHPERFEGKEIDVRGQHYDLLPFGSGRRTCPGMRLGLSVVQVTLANLVKSFDWELPYGQTHNSLDMSEKRGITNGKAIPLLAIPKPRLPWTTA